MADLSTGAGNTTRPSIVITRTFDAPRDLVFKAWTDVERLKHWWGPAGATWVSARLDLRPGGSFLYCMRSPDGDEMWGKFVYREIAPPERLVFTNSFADPQGNTVRAPFNPNWPLEILNTLTFTEENGRTTLTMHGEPYAASEAELAVFDAMRDSVRQGLNGTLDQLAVYLASA